MKFSHLADCHIGGWKEEKLRELSLDALKKAIDISIEGSVNFGSYFCCFIFNKWFNNNY